MNRLTRPIFVGRISGTYAHVPAASSSLLLGVNPGARRQTHLAKANRPLEAALVFPGGYGSFGSGDHPGFIGEYIELLRRRVAPGNRYFTTVPLAFAGTPIHRRE